MRNDHLPKAAIYATSARLGGSGLDEVARETTGILQEEGILGKAIAYENRQQRVPASKIRSLRFHPVRLLSFLDSEHYYGAKRHYVDWIAAREIASGKFDFFHGWSGDCLHTLRLARERGIPSLIEIPTWHRNKGKIKPALTASERKRDAATFPQNLLNRCLISRQRVLEEYDLADVIFVLSEKARETFLVQGFAPEKLFHCPRCVDVDKFHPAPPDRTKPPIFRAIFVGALIKRKGVQHLLEAWHRLQLPDAELILAGSVHDEIKPFLERFASPTVKTGGFTQDVVSLYQNASVQIFPSECEGSAKVLGEAAACGLPQITTRESGDIVIDGFNGLIIPPNDVDALAAAIRRLYDAPDLRANMAVAARQRILENFTLTHYRSRLLEAYQTARHLQKNPPLDRQNP